MKYAGSCFLYIIALSVCNGTATGGTAATANAVIDISEQSPPLQATFKIGKSALFHTPSADQSMPMNITASARIFELFEPSATLLIGSSTGRPDDPALTDRVLAGAFEIRMSPEFRSWYRPSIGVGWFYSEWWPNPTGNRNRGIFCSLTLIGAAPRRLRLPIRYGGGRTFIQPTVSIGDIRFGPFVPWGKRWSENSGNYYVEVTLFSIGVTLW